MPQDEDITDPQGFFRGMPTWDRVMALPYQDRMRAFRDPEIRKALSAEAVEGTVAQQGGVTDRRGRARGTFNRRWDLVEVFMTTKGQNRHLEGKSVEQIAREQNKSIMDAFLDLSLDEDLQTCFQTVDRNNDPATQKHILGSQYTVIGTSDGGGRPHTADRHETSTHLLGHWVREQQAMTLEEAVYRLTGKTALMHDITDRGFIAAGKVADITIFDPDTIAEKPREPVASLPAGGVAGQARGGRHRLCRRQRPGAARQGRADRRAARPDRPRPALPGRAGLRSSFVAGLGPATKAEVSLCKFSHHGNPAIFSGSRRVRNGSPN